MDTKVEIRTVLHGFRFYQKTTTNRFNRSLEDNVLGLALARILLEKHDLLILDEPTNHLDIETLTWLEGLFTLFSCALVIVSHDQYFLDRVCNEVYEISHKACEYYKETTPHYLGNVSNAIYSSKSLREAATRDSRLEEFIAKTWCAPQPQNVRNHVVKLENGTFRKTKRRSALCSFEFTGGTRIRKPKCYK